jgi:hypothetical protein
MSFECNVLLGTEFQTTGKTNKSTHLISIRLASFPDTWYVIQDRLCTCHLTLRCVRVSLLSWKSNIYIYIFVGTRARACAHACARACGCVHVSLLIQHATRMHYVVTSLWTPLASPHLLLYLINGTIFGKKSLNIKRVF